MRVKELIKELKKYENENPIVLYSDDDYQIEVRKVVKNGDSQFIELREDEILLF